MRLFAKRMLTRAGGMLTPTATKKLRRAAEQLEIGRWIYAAGYRPLHWMRSREELWQLLATKVANERVLYLEFGVWQGDSINYWSKLLKHPEARLHGFDSFEGLPEHWHTDKPKGSFDTGGAIPEVKDSRVEFFKGWFQETLPGYVPPPHERLIVNIDVDIYSSAAYVLNTLIPYISVGTFIYFDEFDYVEHELRAFDEFRSRGTMKFSLYGADPMFRAVVFERVS